jgi:hypothetical protein
VPSQHEGPCPEHARLLNQYSEAAEKLAASSRNLSAAALSYELDAFNRAWAMCQAAWDNSWRCRHELQDHIVEHGC